MNKERNIFKDIIILALCLSIISMIYEYFKKWNRSLLDMYEYDNMNDYIGDSVNKTKEKIDSSFKNKRYIKLKSREESN